MDLKLQLLKMKSALLKAFNPNQPRDASGRWTSGGGSTALPVGVKNQHKVGGLYGITPDRLHLYDKEDIEEYTITEVWPEIKGHGKPATLNPDKKYWVHFGDSESEDSIYGGPYKAGSELDQALIEAVKEEGEPANGKEWGFGYFVMEEPTEEYREKEREYGRFMKERTPDYMSGKLTPKMWGELLDAKRKELNLEYPKTLLWERPGKFYEVR